MRKDNEIEYLLNIHSKIQDMVIKTEDRSIGATNIATIIAILSVFVTDLNGKSKEETNNIYCLFLPLGVLAVLSIYIYHNRISAILRGYLAGVEDILSKKIGKNIFIYNRGYAVLFHFPNFITNDIMGFLFVSVGVLGIIYSFYQILLQSLLPISLIILYIIVCIFFGSVFTYEFITNGKIKDKSRTYFHLAYKNDVLEYNINTKAFESYTKAKSVKFDINISNPNNN